MESGTGGIKYKWSGPRIEHIGARFVGSECKGGLLPKYLNLFCTDSDSSQRTVTPDNEPEFEFSDTKAMTCLLCARQFKSLDVLKRHNKESDLHKVCCLYPLEPHADTHSFHSEKLQGR